MPHYRKNMTIFLMYSKGMSTLASSTVMFSNLLLVKRINSKINIYCKKVLKISLHMKFIRDGLDNFFSNFNRIPDIRIFFTGYPTGYPILPLSGRIVLLIFSIFFPTIFFYRKLKTLSGGIPDIRPDTGYPAGNRISGFQNINFSAGSR